MFLLCCVFVVASQILSCSSENLEVDVENNFLEAKINDSDFFADDVFLILEGDLLTITGNNTKTGKSIHITVKRSSKTDYVFGLIPENEDGNEAVLVENSGNIEFTTHNLQKNSGSVSFDITQWDSGKLSGVFYFEAKSDNGQMVKITSGRFKKDFNPLQ